MVSVDEDSDSSLSSILSDLTDKGDLEPRTLRTTQITSRRRNGEDPPDISKVKKKVKVSNTTVIEKHTIIAVKSPDSANIARKTAAQPGSRATKTKAQSAVSRSSPQKKKSMLLKEAVEDFNLTSVKAETVKASQTQAPKPRKRTKIQNIKPELVDDAEDPVGNRIVTKGKRESKIKKAPQPASSEFRHPISADESTPKKTPRKRKTKEAKEAEAMPLAARSKSLRMFIGAHVSCAKGGALLNPLYIDYLKLRSFM